MGECITVNRIFAFDDDDASDDENDDDDSYVSVLMFR